MPYSARPPNEFLHFTRSLTSKFAYWENDVTVDKPTGINWIHSMCGANDASCTSDGTTSYLTMKSCIVPACSTSRTSFASEDWVSLGTSPDFDAVYQQTRSYKSAPSRGTVSGLHRSGDAPVADRRPPGPTRSTATRVYQRPRPCS